MATNSLLRNAFIAGASGLLWDTRRVAGSSSVNYTALLTRVQAIADQVDLAISAITGSGATPGQISLMVTMSARLFADPGTMTVASTAYDELVTAIAAEFVATSLLLDNAPTLLLVKGTSGQTVETGVSGISIGTGLSCTLVGGKLVIWHP
jgi:hypothetical protein